MRQVFDNRMVAHVWAQQNQGHGRSGNGQFYFNDTTIFSYGAHFPIAKFVTNDKDEKAVLFTNRSSSVTTTQHMSYVRRAIPEGLEVIWVNDPTRTAYENYLKYASDLENALRLLPLIPKRARAKRAAMISDIHTCVIRANRLVEFFSLNANPLSVPEDIEAHAQELAKQVAERKEYQRKLAEEASIKVKEAWKDHLKIDPYQERFLSYGPILMRVTRDGLNIETTRGAVFPLNHGKLAYRMLKAIKASGQEWHRNGKSIHLGHFQIDHVDIDGNVTAGCHQVAWEEIERLGRELGLENTTDEISEEVPSGG